MLGFLKKQKTKGKAANFHSSASGSPTRISLSALVPGQRATVSGLQLDGLLYRRLLDLGIVEGTDIEALVASPPGDPVVYRVRERGLIAGAAGL